MAIQQIIDCDAHIDETEETWEFLREFEQNFKPTTGSPANPDPNRPPTRYWLIDGHRQPRLYRDDRRSQTTVETRELLDPMARVRHMDELGTAVQVIYPSTLLVGITETPEVEVAIKRAYNRWLADRTEKTNGRLRWMAMPPMTDIPTALEEIRFAKDHGACGIFKKGDKEGGHWVSEEYFYPIWEECEKLDLAVAFHTGSGVPDFTSAREFDHARYMRISVPPLNAFQALVTFGIPYRFPGVRWGFIEAGSSWVPYLVYKIMRGAAKGSQRGSGSGYQYSDPSDLVRLNKLYITCQVDEDLPYIMKYTGDDHLLVGSDYTHADPSEEREFAKVLQERADRGDFPQSAVQRITYENGKTFYGL
jgi:predicted TIM-barrel fold metal-dependent hydrolase